MNKNLPCRDAENYASGSVLTLRNLVVLDCAEVVHEHEGLLVIECMGADTERRHRPRTATTSAALAA